MEAHMEVTIIEKDNLLLGLRILSRLNKERLTMYQLAKRTHIAESAIQRICAGEAKNPGAWTIAAIADVLGVSTDWLLGREDPP
jgi:transcriptional regulator with XRE-family HTH domain